MHFQDVQMQEWKHIFTVNAIRTVKNRNIERRIQRKRVHSEKREIPQYSQVVKRA